METISQEPLSQAICDRAPAPELYDPFYAGTALAYARECWGLERRVTSQQWGKGGLWERSYPSTLSFLPSFPSFFQESVTTPFSEWVDAKTTWQGVNGHVSCGKLMGQE